MLPDNYSLAEISVKEPPNSFGQKLKFLGPGFILSASIVGSGELIATTTLGAKAGFIMFWIIIISCLVKVAVQLEFGRHAIHTGETPMKAFNKLPGFRIKKGSWALWSIFLLIGLKIIQLGGMLGGTAIVLHLIFPALPIIILAIFVALLASALIYNGYYKIVEKSSLIMIAMFTVLTIISLFSLRYTSYRFSFHDILSGFEFKLPAEFVGVAFGAFGITGVGADEIIAYNYWCLEKGYAAYTGPKSDDPAWRQRAKGWIRVMYLDAVFSMIIYTTVTAAFYLLGAAILHNRGAIPAGNDLIETIALIYTQSIGPGIRSAYLVGAFIVLFSSVFACLAAWTRFFSDVFGQLGWMDFFDVHARKKMIAILAWVIPALWVMAYFFINLPVIMVLAGGVIGSVMLLLVVFAAIHFFKKQPADLSAGPVYTIFFLISVFSIILVAAYGIVKLFS